MNKKTARGSKDGPKVIYGMKNLNWEPKRATRNPSLSSTRIPQDFHSETQEDHVMELSERIMRTMDWGIKMKNSSSANLSEVLKHGYSYDDGWEKLGIGIYNESKKLEMINDKISEFIANDAYDSPEEVLGDMNKLVADQHIYFLVDHTESLARCYETSREFFKKEDSAIESAIYGDTSYPDFNEEEYFNAVDFCRDSFDKMMLGRKRYAETIDTAEKLAEYMENNHPEYGDLTQDIVDTARRQHDARMQDMEDNPNLKPEWGKGAWGVDRYKNKDRSLLLSEDALNTPELTGKKMAHLKQISAISGRSLDDVSAEYQSRLQGDAPKQVEEALVSMFRDAIPVDEHEWIGTDIETTNFGPKNGYIIEMATSRNGETKNQLYGIPDVHAETQGTGVVDVHGINQSDIENERTFRFSDSGKEFSRMFTSGTEDNPTVIYAHHGGEFEDEWLRKNLTGYAKAQMENRLVMVDTKLISNFSVGMKKNSLKDFVEWSGNSYDGAHRADADTLMMENAMKTWATKKRNGEL